MRDSLYLDRETHLESQLLPSGISLYGHDPMMSGIRSSGLGRAGAPIVTQVDMLNITYIIRVEISFFVIRQLLYVQTTAWCEHNFAPT